MIFPLFYRVRQLHRELNILIAQLLFNSHSKNYNNDSFPYYRQPNRQQCVCSPAGFKDHWQKSRKLMYAEETIEVQNDNNKNDPTKCSLQSFITLFSFVALLRYPVRFMPVASLIVFPATLRYCPRRNGIKLTG